MTFSLVNVLAISFVLLGIFGFSQQKKEGDKTAKISFVLIVIAAFLTILVNAGILQLPVAGTFMAVVYFSMLGLSPAGLAGPQGEVLLPPPALPLSAPAPGLLPDRPRGLLGHP